jgi:hypothetical protein
MPTMLIVTNFNQNIYMRVASLRFSSFPVTLYIRISLSQHKSDNNMRMIQLTDVFFCFIVRYKRA